jgi:hypothetical protein
MFPKRKRPAHGPWSQEPSQPARPQPASKPPPPPPLCPPLSPAPCPLFSVFCIYIDIDIDIRHPASNG